MTKRFSCHNTGIIDQKFCREIICSVDDKVIILNDIHDIFGCDEFTISINLDIRIDRLHGFLC